MSTRYRWFSLFPRSLILSLAICIYIPSSAQLNPGFLTQYTELDGVPGSQVNCILPDRFGYIWVGTINGLARYDGYEFKRYFNNPNDTGSIQGSIVWSLFEDHKGQIWIGAAPGFLNVYNPATKTFRQYDYKNLVNHPANVEIGITTIGEDKNGRIYLGLSSFYGDEISTGLLYIDEKDDKVKKLIADDKNQVRNVLSMTNDTSGNTWLISYSGLFKIDNNGKINKMFFDSAGGVKFVKENDFPSDLKCDKSGHLWVITNSSRLCDFDPKEGSYKVYVPDGVFPHIFYNNRITMDKNENIWMGTNKGLLKFNRITKQFEVFKTESAKQVEKASMSYLHFDSFGSLWIGTIANGVLKYEEKAVFKSYSFSIKEDKNSITPGWTGNLCETYDGKIWISTEAREFRDRNGLNELDLQTNTIRPIPYRTFLSKGVDLISFYEHTPGEFIMSTDRGFFQYTVKTNQAKKIPFYNLADSIVVNKFRTDSRGNLWLCTMHGLYRKSKGTETFTKYDLSVLEGSNATSNQVTDAIESKKHGVWLTTDNGLFLYNYTTDKIERHGFDKKAGDIFFTQDINSFYEDSTGIAWVGGWQGGLSRYDVETKKIKTFTRENGLPSMSIQGILADEKNNVLWLSTFDGLSRFDLTTLQFNNFSITDGIQSQLFADASHLKTTDGLFLFGGSNGITVFRPDDISKNSTPPKVFLTDLKLFNKSILPGDNSILKKPIYDTKEIILDHNQNNISLEFIALHYANPSKNRYAYKLENYDNEWREGAGQHVAFYSNLPPGEYVFHVKAANNNGVWNEEGAKLSIIVKAPWWKTTWAYIIYLLIFGGLAFAIDRYFRHRLVQKERERSRSRELEQAKEIEKAYYKLEQTHESLKSTQSQLIQSEKMASLGELTAGIAHEIQNPLNFVNNFSEVNKELLAEMKEEINKGNLDEAKSIANDVIENEQKISHHGKRADSIVKGMLQHSRSSGGHKEPTDINALVDEYLRLAYHGLRAKDNSFNATLKTDYDKNAGNIPIIPQDMGRALLNLYTNAFYAVTEKKRQLVKNGPDTTAYEPTVTVSTKAIRIATGASGIVISVKDNGNGIPQKVLDKIFQPFFTTKPTGQGTGLGLSLAYDIIKAHGGELKVETQDGEGVEFIIELPFA